MLISVENRLKAVQNLVSTATRKDLDEEIGSYLCKLGAVLICGTIERSIEVLVDEKVSKRSAPQVAAFLQSYFKSGRNYTCDEIARLLYKFDQKWGISFENYIKYNDRIKVSVNSCYAIRNSIAHGGTQTLAASSLRQYSEDAFSLMAELEGLMRTGH